MRENTDYFPDGTPVDPWFYDPSVPFGAAGKEYPVLENGVRADGTLQTRQLQALIDRISASGGGTVVVSGGTFLTGALYFKQGVHLRIGAGAVLMGSKAYLYCKEVEVLEYRADGTVRVRMKDTGNVYEVPARIVFVKESQE